MTASRLDRRRFLTAATAGTVLATVASTASEGATATAAGSRRWKVAPTFRWLGTAAWRIDIGDRTVLVDPYLSRFRTGLFDGTFNPATPLSVDAAAIAANIGDPQTVLVTHSHWDHFNDVPQIARSTGARVFGTLTTYQLALAMGVPAAQLSPVKGGEVLDLGGFTIEVIAALHSRNASYSMAFPGVREDRPAPPQTIADLPEGDTLAYVLRVPDGPTVFFMGASDFAERNLDGVEPDIAMIAVPSTDATHAYVPRLIRALGRPRTVVPVHWENFETPLQNPPQIGSNDVGRLDTFVDAVRRAAPGTRVVVPEYSTGYRFQ